MSGKSLSSWIWWISKDWGNILHSHRDLYTGYASSTGVEWNGVAMSQQLDLPGVSMVCGRPSEFYMDRGMMTLSSREKS